MYKLRSSLIACFPLTIIIHIFLWPISGITTHRDTGDNCLLAFLPRLQSNCHYSLAYATVSCLWQSYLRPFPCNCSLLFLPGAFPSPPSFIAHFSMTTAVVRCSRLRSPANGDVNVTSLMYSSIASYSCRQGFGLVGSPSRTCQADGTWSGSTPRCRGEHVGYS